MSTIWNAAPLYVQSHDLAVWIEGCFDARGADVVAAARALVCDLALALTFARERREHQAAADRDIVRLRVRMRLAQAAGRLSARQLRYAEGELSSIGRMLGGWRKRPHRRRASADGTGSTGTRSARTGSSGTAPGGQGATASGSTATRAMRTRASSTESPPGVGAPAAPGA